jgi:hypothetical protein
VAPPDGIVAAIEKHVREVVRAELRSAPSFGWVRCGPSTVPRKTAIALARKGEAKVTKIGKYVFVAREDVENIAAKNAITSAPDAANDVDPLEAAGIDSGVANGIRKAFGGAR